MTKKTDTAGDVAGHDLRGERGERRGVGTLRRGRCRAVPRLVVPLSRTPVFGQWVLLGAKPYALALSPPPLCCQHMLAESRPSKSGGEPGAPPASG